jgi:UDP-2-acetamido-2,6-beta-L-arabino-hexul-4-ose reductase
MTRKILVTGAYGFVGTNLSVYLNELSNTDVLTFSRDDSLKTLKNLVFSADFIIHLAGENRPKNPKSFDEVNTELTRKITDIIQETGRNIPLILTSSLQATNDSAYGKSKLAAEIVVKEYAKRTKNSVSIFRLPGIFGKWCKPNYNSVVATFCYNIARELPIVISDPAIKLNLVYIDDLVHDFMRLLENFTLGLSEGKLTQIYNITIGELESMINSFENGRKNLLVEKVGDGITRALYATYISYLPVEKFSYEVPKYDDNRGSFVEMLKTPESGQFSFFTIQPNITRGSHYHHSKTEKFLIIKGLVRLKFRHLITNEEYEITISGGEPTIVDSIPGWIHNITNIGDSEACVMLWANEIFDRDQPDTVAQEV